MGNYIDREGVLAVERGEGLLLYCSTCTICQRDAL